MCELSVNDGEQQSKQNEGDRNQCDDWNDIAENWVENEVMCGHKIENRVLNEMINDNKMENWVQNR